MKTTPRKNYTGQKGALEMYSICVKFKESSNWRPYCRQFKTLQGAYNETVAAFDKWPVHHVSVFHDGKFLQCYWRNPEETAAARRVAYMLNRRTYGIGLR